MSLTASVTFILDKQFTDCLELKAFLTGELAPFRGLSVSELACLPKICATNATDDLSKRDNEVSAIDGAVEAPLALPSLVS